MKRFIIALLSTMGIIFLVHYFLFDNLYTVPSISNSFFVVGILMFFLSLIALTDATKMFLILSYSFQSIFKRSIKSQSYYDYMQSKKRKKTPLSLQMFLLSIAYLVVAYALAYSVL